MMFLDLMRILVFTYSNALCNNVPNKFDKRRKRSLYSEKRRAQAVHRRISINHNFDLERRKYRVSIS